MSTTPRRASASLCNPAMVELEPVGGRRPTADDPARPRQRALSVEDNGMGDMLRFDAERLRILVERHLLTPAARGRASCSRTGTTRSGQFVKVMPKDYKRALLQARDRAAAKAVAAGLVSISMGKPTGFLEIERKDRPYEKVEARLKTLEGIRPAAAAGRGRAAGRALHGLRHSVLSQRLPGQQPDPRLERPGPSRPLAGRARGRCTRPTTSRNSPAASARRPARRPAR